MNLEEKNNIAKLQRKGLGYRRIANELNLSPNTVKSYLKKTVRKYLMFYLRKACKANGS